MKTSFLSEKETDEWALFFEDEEACAYIPKFDLPTHKEVAAFWIERQVARYNEKRYGLQALRLKDTGEFIGLCGLLMQEVDGVEELEIGYHVLKKHWGKGYAPEAAKVFLDYAQKNLGVDSVISIIDVENMKSQRVAEKNGFVREKRTVFMGLDVYIYRYEKI